MAEPTPPGARDTAAPPSPIRVQHVTSAAELEGATHYLDAAEDRAGVPLVDEAERERLRRAQADGAAPDSSWRPMVAVHDDQVVGYGAVTVPSGGQDTAVGDLVMPTDPSLRSAVRSVLLHELRAASSDIEVARLQVWMRHVTDNDLAGVTEDGFGVARRLAILGRTLAQKVEVPPAGEWTVRAYRPGADDAGVVEVLAVAYEGTGDGGWTMERFAERVAMPWFRAEDLLVAEDGGAGDDAGAGGAGDDAGAGGAGDDAGAGGAGDDAGAGGAGDDAGAGDGRLLGLHWLKRHGPTVGEVYNLAVHPDGQGRGLGSLLLVAGLAHLQATGCDDVLLWVDRANDRAVRLYTGQGFTTRWDDVALEWPLVG